MVEVKQYMGKQKYTVCQEQYECEYHYNDDIIHIFLLYTHTDFNKRERKCWCEYTPPTMTQFPQPYSREFYELQPGNLSINIKFSYYICARTYAPDIVSWRAIYVQRAADNKRVTPLYIYAYTFHTQVDTVWVSICLLVFMVHWVINRSQYRL